MIKINLLPWREELRKEKQQEFNNALAIAVMLTASVVAMIHFYIADKQDYQAQRNRFLQNEIMLLDQQMVDIKNLEEKKTRLINKVSVIYNLQRSRPEIVHLFNEIPKFTPDGLFMTKMTRVGRDLIFEGKAKSNALVSAFMSSIQRSLWLQPPTLDVVQTDKFVFDKNSPVEKMNDFTLRTKQRDLPDVN